MRISYASVFYCLLIGIASCRQAAPPVSKAVMLHVNDPQLHLLNGVLYYKEALFTGKLSDRWNGNTIRMEQEYNLGRQQGREVLYYENGRPEAERWFTKGEKDSVHLGWWPNGNKKFEYHFSMGNYNGPFREWYEDGKMLQELIYANGTELSAKGWRRNGKLYMNYIVKDGRRYGMANANLCYTVETQK